MVFLGGHEDPCVWCDVWPNTRVRSPKSVAKPDQLSLNPISILNRLDRYLFENWRNRSLCHRRRSAGIGLAGSTRNMSVGWASGFVWRLSGPLPIHIAPVPRSLTASAQRIGFVRRIFASSSPVDWLRSARFRIVPHHCLLCTAYCLRRPMGSFGAFSSLHSRVVRFVSGEMVYLTS
jgi:hypothetical protein